MTKIIKRHLNDSHNSKQSQYDFIITKFFCLFSQGKRDENTNVDAAKAKADAKVY